MNSALPATAARLSTASTSTDHAPFGCARAKRWIICGVFFGDAAATGCDSAADVERAPAIKHTPERDSQLRVGASRIVSASVGSLLSNGCAPSAHAVPATNTSALET